MNSVPQVIKATILRRKAITLRSVLQDLGIVFVIAAVFDVVLQLLKGHHPQSIAGEFAYWVALFAVFQTVKFLTGRLGIGNDRPAKNQPDRDEAHRA